MATHAFPDMHAAIDDEISEGDRIVIRSTWSGTHTGEFLGIPPSGKTLRITATGFFRVRDGKITENRVNFDALGMLQQMGVVPEAGQAPA